MFFERLLFFHHLPAFDYRLTAWHRKSTLKHMAGLRETKKQIVKEKIVKAAEEIFITQGFTAATTKKIAKAAGIGEGTIYNHFATKTDILLYIYESRFSGFKKFEWRLPSSPAAVPDFLMECFDAFFEKSRSIRKEWLREIFSAIYRKDKEGKTFMSQAQSIDNLLLAKLMEILTALCGRGLIKKDIDLDMVIETIYALFMFHYSNYSINEDLDFNSFFSGLKKGVFFIISAYIL